MNKEVLVLDSHDKILLSYVQNVLKKNKIKNIWNESTA